MENRSIYKTAAELGIEPSAETIVTTDMVASGVRYFNENAVAKTYEQAADPSRIESLIRGVLEAANAARLECAEQSDYDWKRRFLDRWKDCPSTHCERSGECRSPSECSAKVRPRVMMPEKAP